MNEHVEAGLKVAESLLKIKAVKLKPEEPFTWASGWKSPIYCDNRKTLSYPEIRTFIRQQFTTIIESEFSMPDVIAGVATGGIAIGALVAQELGLPFVYVRSSAKGHGMQNMVEGVIESGQSVIVIEDLISTGMSSLKAVAALKEIGCNIKGMVAIFSYGFQIAEDAFKKEKITLHTLTNYNQLIEQAVNLEYISAEKIDTLKSWRENPSEWGK
jgi:orotate phosphoribosyltransferase